MRWMVRILGFGVVSAAAAVLGAGCAAQVDVGGAQLTVGTAPVAGRASCASVCPQMAACPAKGPACPQTCQAATNLTHEAQCEASLQAELDCLGSQTADICGATRNACNAQTAALGACISNYCLHPRMGADTAGWCLQAAAGF